LDNIVLAIDIGSTKICAIIAKIEDDNGIKIIGSGQTKSHGLKKGSITNIELASKSIKNALTDAKRVAGTDIKRAIVSISGAYTKSLNSNGIVNIPHKEISIKEINRVMHAALYNANIPNEYEVLHALPYNFKVDEQDCDDPLGMNAARLEVQTHIITTQKSNLYNLKKAVKAAGIEIDNIILSGYASAIATLSHDEKELGAVIIDMGGNTCNMVIHVGNSIRYNDFLGVGSNHITNDLSMALHTPLNVAENVKMNYGTLDTPNNDLIELPMIGDDKSTHEVSLEVVHNVIYARVEETLMILAQSLEKSRLKEHIGAGVILTGGFSKIDGLRNLATAIFDNMPVRLASPTNIEGLFDDIKGPEYSCTVGLVKYAANDYTPYEIDVNKRLRYHGETPIYENEVVLDDVLQSNINNDTISPTNENKTNNQSVFLKTRPKQNNENSVITKFWNWATQLF